jgi:hypothetical protein
MGLISLTEAAANEKFDTNILVDKFEQFEGEWTFELKDTRWYTISEDPKLFLGMLVHMLQKTWFTARDAQVLIDWAATKFNWDIHGDGDGHNPRGLNAALRNPANLSVNQPKD